MMKTNSFELVFYIGICLFKAFAVASLFSITFLIGGCNGAFAGTRSNPTQDLRLGDFSELRMPGTQRYSASFVVATYEVPLEKFAILRIFAAGLEDLTAKDDRADYFSDDGLFAAVGRSHQQAAFAEALVESLAEHKRSISYLFYENQSEKYVIESYPETGILIYEDLEGYSHSLNVAQGRLGFTVRVRLDVPLSVTVSPSYQSSDSLSKSFLRLFSDTPNEGRVEIVRLSIAALMEGGDFMIICPDMIPFDNMTFSKYAFTGEKESTFRIYTIFCKNIASRG